MHCPPEIANVIAEILRLGVLRIRTYGSLGDSRRCVHEADHIHNLPDLLVDYRPAMLAFYWQTERPLFIRQVPDGECAAFEPSWARLKPFADQALGSSSSAGLGEINASPSLADASTK
jgi:hypothetical protein